MNDVRFFFTHYVPNNAIMVVAGNVKLNQIKELSENGLTRFHPKPWTRGAFFKSRCAQKRTFSMDAKVPANALYKAWHMPVAHHDYYAADLSSDILSQPKQPVVSNVGQGKEIFTSVSAYVMGTVDPGLFVVSGRLKPALAWSKGVAEVGYVLNEFLSKGPTTAELDKSKKSGAVNYRVWQRWSIESSHEPGL